MDYEPVVEEQLLAHSNVSTGEHSDALYCASEHISCQAIRHGVRLVVDEAQFVTNESAVKHLTCTESMSEPDMEEPDKILTDVQSKQV